jgi:hypothetical protein
MLADRQVMVIAKAEMVIEIGGAASPHELKEGEHARRGKARISNEVLNFKGEMDNESSNPRRKNPTRLEV